MKKEALYEAMGNICDDYIKSAHETKKPKNAIWVKWGAVAACVCLIATVAVWGGVSRSTTPLPPVHGDTSGIAGTEGKNTEALHPVFATLAELQRPYGDVAIGSGEEEVAWKWEYLTVYEKYMELDIEGVRYARLGERINAAVIGEKLGTYEAVGYNAPYDTPEGGYREHFDAYEIKGVSAERMVALKMEEHYYCFISDAARSELRQMAWGEVLDAYGLASVLPLGDFSKYSDGRVTAYYTLFDDAYLWEVLASCKDAPFVDSRAWQRSENYLCFTVTVDAFGIYKKALYITEDGYLWSNFLDVECIYNIGADAAGKMIAYAEKHSEETEMKPYREALVGTVTEITDTYVLVNDGVMCENESDGITFKILLNDLRINRYVDDGRVEMGMLVSVTFEGMIDVDGGYVIDGARSMHEAFLFDGDVLIPE